MGVRRVGIALLVGLLAATACGGDGADVGVGTDETPAATEPDRSVSSIVEPSAEVRRAAPDPSAPTTELASGFNDAGFDLLRTQPLADNLVFSPTSIGHALLMAAAAADEPTAAAIDEAFGLPDGVSAHQAWNAVDHAIAAAAAAEDEVEVTIADRIWPRLDVQPDQDWVDLLAAEHGSDVVSLDFVEDPAGSTDEINGWVSDQTAGLIPELLPPGFVKPDTTVLVLTDALYFKARWLQVFGKYGTEDTTFTRLDSSTVPVELMRELELDDRRGTGDGFVGAEIPYVGGQFSMLVVVPDEGRFEEVRSRLDQRLLDEVDATFTTGPYELLIPQWDDTTSIDLLPWLIDLGAAPGMFPAISPRAFLGGAVHGADILVDEWGTVAAAATGLGFEDSGPPEPELTVRADHPFLYVIRHRSSGLVLFAGQVTDPTA